jgi:hypothetical protein
MLTVSLQRLHSQALSTLYAVITAAAATAATIGCTGALSAWL